MEIQDLISTHTVSGIEHLYGKRVAEDKITVNQTPRDFVGDYTLVTFPLAGITGKPPHELAEELGLHLQKELDIVESYNVVKGFLNLSLTDTFWIREMQRIRATKDHGRGADKNSTVVVEYCGPNTNKPLHLGHVRNMLLGYSMAEILAFAGHAVKKVNIYNDRGIAICKSMVAWLREGEGKTPADAGVKGDHFIGRWYVAFDKILDRELGDVELEGKERKEAEKQTAIYKEAQETLLKWEAGDEQTLELWQRMNDWVYEGFEETYRKIGVDFDKAYYESKTYLDGKRMVQEGLDSGAFFKKDDGSVWVDLTDDGLDQKILLRNDGTAVYLTQDLGTAQERYDDYTMDQSIYVVANEQDYHFQVLKLTLAKLGKAYAEGIYHLSYGMVNLPSGKMKSRQGNTVDADDLIAEMVDTARQQTIELGKIDELADADRDELFRVIGLGALKFFILKINPKKTILFDPKESIDFQGHTGPFIQFNYTRIRALQRKAQDKGIVADGDLSGVQMHPVERELANLVYRFPFLVQDAAAQFNPSLIAEYAFSLAKTYSRFYAELPVLNAENSEEMRLRLLLSQNCGEQIRSAMKLLGIDVPDRM